MTPRDFIAAASRQPFAWGRHDCLLLAADWVRTATGRDPAEAWRGTYASALGALRLIRRAGGLEALARTAMSSAGGAGFPETTAPRDGDVAIVAGAVEHRKGRPWASQAAAVRCGGLWIVRTPRGLVGNRAPLITPVTAWRIA